MKMIQRTMLQFTFMKLYHTGCPGKLVPLGFRLFLSYLNAAIRTSKTIFEILKKRAFYRAQELHDSL